MKYVMAVGFSFLYAFVLLTAAVPTTFVYIFLIFIMIIPYGDLKLCFITGGISILSNIISVVVNFANSSLTTDDLAIVEIQVLSVIISALFSTLATKVNGKVSNQRIAQINAEKEKINALLTHTLEISKGISEDIEVVTGRMEHLAQSASATKYSMQDVSSGAQETANALQEQLLKTEDIMKQVSKAKMLNE